MKKISPLILLLVLCISCNKSDDFNPAIHAEIASPYLEEVLIDLGIDSDGILNQQVLISDIENIQDLSIITELFQKVEEPYDQGCQNLKYNYDITNNDLLSGIDNFKNLQKLVLIIRQAEIPNSTGWSCGDDVYTFPNGNTTTEHLEISVEIDNLDKLEELYFSNFNSYYQFLNLTVSNCNKIK